jgi:hypothetical protein
MNCAGQARDMIFSGFGARVVLRLTTGFAALKDEDSNANNDDDAQQDGPEGSHVIMPRIQSESRL